MKNNQMSREGYEPIGNWSKCISIFRLCGNPEERDPAPGGLKPEEPSPPIISPDLFQASRFFKLYGIGPAEAAERGLDELDLYEERKRRMRENRWDEVKKLKNYRGEK